MRLRAAADGTTEVVLSESGLITAVSGSTMTVKSSDRFEATYTVDKDTRISLNGADGALSKLEADDAVHVVATKTGTTAHAESVIDGLPAGFMRLQKERAPSAVPPSARPSAS